MADNYRKFSSVFRGKTSRDRNGYVVLTHARLVIEGSPATNQWLLLDRDNGNPENGHGYVWIFPTRKAARDHKKAQNADSMNACVLGPWRVGDCTSEFLKTTRLR